MSSHPGCTLDDAIELALYIRRSGHRPEQVQDFYPTPGTLSTAMFYTGLDPRDMSEVYVPRSPEEKAMQRALMQYFLPQNRELVVKALRKAGRTDLIGFGPDCLIRPERAHAASPAAVQKPNRTGKSAARPNSRRENAPQDRRARAENGRSGRKPASDSRRPKR